MAEDGRKGNQRPLPRDGVEVTAAQAAGSYPDQDLAGSRSGQVDLSDTKSGVQAGKHGSSHLPSGS
jgi:hypothetical protein